MVRIADPTARRTFDVFRQSLILLWAEYGMRGTYTKVRPTRGWTVQNHEYQTARKVKVCIDCGLI